MPTCTHVAQPICPQVPCGVHTNTATFISVASHNLQHGRTGSRSGTRATPTAHPSHNVRCTTTSQKNGHACHDDGREGSVTATLAAASRRLVAQSWRREGSGEAYLPRPPGRSQIEQWNAAVYLVNVRETAWALHRQQACAALREGRPLAKIGSWLTISRGTSNYE
jgi:hypothetical protein